MGVLPQAGSLLESSLESSLETSLEHRKTKTQNLEQLNLEIKGKKLF